MHYSRWLPIDRGSADDFVVVGLPYFHWTDEMEKYFHILHTCNDYTIWPTPPRSTLGLSWR